MSKPLVHLIPHYVLLILLFLTGGISLVVLEDGLFKWSVLAALAALYVIWGIWHHYEDKSLTHQVILEYTGIAMLLAIILLLATS